MSNISTVATSDRLRTGVVGAAQVNDVRIAGGVGVAARVTTPDLVLDRFPM